MKEKDYNGFKVVLEDNLIKVISEMKDWKEEKNSGIDDVTYYLEKDENLNRNPNAEGCLVAYETGGKNAEEIISNLPQKCEQETKQGISDEPAVDERENVELKDAQEKSIRELFRIKLNLPSYQRPYRWGRKNIEFFWDDIKKSEGKYDFGTVVFHRRENGVYDIVDGQQRIVTLSLILRSLSSHEADSFINNTTLQGKDSEKNIGYNLQWFRRQAEKLNAEEMKNKILEGSLDIIVMDDIDEALKFFDRTNTTGVPLTETDKLKSHHLLALSSCKSLSEEAKNRWKEENFGVPVDALDNIFEFKKGVVREWENLNPWGLNKILSIMCTLRLMAKGVYAISIDEITDIEQLRKGDNKDGKYTGLDSPISDGEFFFWYVFKVYKKYQNLEEDYKIRKHSAFLRSLLCNHRGKAVWRAQQMFDLLVLYIDEKYSLRNEHQESGEKQYDKVLDLVFSWLVYYCLYYDSLQFAAIRNSALKEDSIFNAIVSSKSIVDCFDCYSENPYDRLMEEGLVGRIEGDGVKYLIRRELRRIYGKDDENR